MPESNVGFEESSSTVGYNAHWRGNWCLVLVMAVVVAGVFAVEKFDVQAAARNQEASIKKLEILNTAFLVYTADNKGELFPPLAPYEDLWIFDVSVLYPNYISDLRTLVSPYAPKRKELILELQQMTTDGEIDWERVARIAAQSYVYTGWALDEGKGFRELSEARTQIAVDKYDDDIRHEHGYTYRLREGIERFFIGDS
jgi:hypothetical protein